MLRLGLAAAAIAAGALLGRLHRPLNIARAQACIDRLTAVQSSHMDVCDIFTSDKWQTKKEKNPTEIMRAEFPATEILATLPRLHMKRGTTIDYVYHMANAGGSPVLYSRPDKAEPYKSFDELARAKPHAQAKGRLKDTWSQGFGFYLDDIRTDGTAEGYFQLVVLYLMGDQFYHMWHDGYHDERIVCTSSGLEDAFKSTGSDPRHRITDDKRRAISAMPIEPRVNIQSDVVSVSIVVFSKFFGFQRRIYTISRHPPHAMLNEQRKLLVDYYCGYVI